MASAATEEVERDYTVYAGKAPSQTIANFADWLIENVGVEFKTAASEAAWRDGVRLGATLRMEFQRSPENQEDLARRRQEAEERKAAAATAEPKPRKAAKKAAAVAEPEPEEEEEQPTARPAKVAKKVAKRTAAPVEEEPAEEAAPATRRRGAPARRRAAASATTAEAPF